MECVPGAWVLATGEMGRIVLMEESSKGYSLGYGHICMCNNYEGTSYFSCSPHRYGHLCMCNGYGLIGRGLEGARLMLPGDWL